MKVLRLQWSDDTPVKTRLSSTLDFPKKVISPERSLVLPPVMDTDRYEALCMQLETVRLNGACALDLIQSVITAVNKLSDDVTQLKSDNMALKIQVQDLQGLMADQIKLPRQQSQGVTSLWPALHKEVVELRSVAPQQNSSRSYAEVANFATHPCTSTQALDSQWSSANDGIIVASGMHEKDRPMNKVSGEDSEGFTTVSFQRSPRL
jgi:hypothetical protein